MTVVRDRQQLRALTRQYDRRIRLAIEEAFNRVALAVDRRALLAALSDGNVSQALHILRIREDLMAPVAEAIRESYIAGGALVGQSVPPGRAVLGFDGRHPRAEQWITKHAADYVVQIVQDQRDAIRNVVFSQVEAGRNPRSMITDIVGRIGPSGRREGGILGLTNEQSSYVFGRYRADGTLRKGALQELQTLDSHYFTRQRRDRRYDSMVRKAIETGNPLSSSQIDKIVGRYEDRLKAYRAEVVARTESINALRAGRDEGFAQAIESGAIDPSRIRKKWSATLDNRTRDDHEDMDGETVAMDEPFTFPDGSQAMYPGDDSLGAPPYQLIQCRCYVQYDIDWLS